MPWRSPHNRLPIRLSGLVAALAVATGLPLVSPVSALASTTPTPAPASIGAPAPLAPAAAGATTDATTATPTGADLCATVADAAGFRGDPLVVAVAVGLAESSCNPNAKASNGATSGCPGGSVDRGLWQINDCYHPEVTNTCAYNAQCNANAAYRISDSGSDWTPWSTFNSGSYKDHLSAARAAVDRLDNTPAPVDRVNASALEYNGLFYVFARGASDELRMNYFVPGTGWDQNHNVEGSVTTQPVAVEHLGSLWVTALGADSAVQYRILDDSGWEPWRTLPGVVAGAPAMVEMNGTLYIFVRMADGTVRYRYHNSAGWNADAKWKPLEGTVDSDPTVTAFNGAMYVFAHGTDGHTTFRYWSSANGWSAWTDLAGNAAGRPTTAIAGKTLHIFTRDTANQVLRDSLTIGAAAWQTNIAMGGSTTTDPSAIAAGTQLHLFVRAPDNTIQYLYYDGTTWTAWRDLAGQATTTLFTGLRGGNRFVFSTDANNQLDYRYWAPNTGWSAWAIFAGTVHS